MKDSLWITWEDHRRSRELAAAFEAVYTPLLYKGNRISRYLVLSLRTTALILKKRPKLVFCQNPSIFLNALLCVLKGVFRFYLVVDRHSNFKFHTASSNSLKWKLFHWLSHFVTRHSDLTIVTNNYLATHIEEKGGRAAVLQDKIPALPLARQVPLIGKQNFVFVSTFSHDEPIDDFIHTARDFDDSTHFYITGNYKKFKGIEKILAEKPENLTLTGFLDEADYQSLLASVDGVVVITDQEHTLTCGAYEAVALGKAMILSNTEAIKHYFCKGAIYADPTASSLSAAIKASIPQLNSLANDTKLLKDELQIAWNGCFSKLRDRISRHS
jgi:glycosyltransferase involved in cell wall biosynthesis